MLGRAARKHRAPNGSGLLGRGHPLGTECQSLATLNGGTISSALAVNPYYGNSALLADKKGGSHPLARASDLI
jgi:hypothetical protein